MPPSQLVARAAFWTLSTCAYVLAIWCTATLFLGFHILPFNSFIHGWSREASFTRELWLIVSLPLLPLTIHFWKSRAYVIVGLGVWCFQFLWFLLPVY